MPFSGEGNILMSVKDLSLVQNSSSRVLRFCNAIQGEHHFSREIRIFLLCLSIEWVISYLTSWDAFQEEQHYNGALELALVDLSIGLKSRFGTPCRATFPMIIDTVFL